MERLEESKWFEIFRVGVWHGVEYTKEMLDTMVKNFQSGDPKPPLIIGHNCPWSGQGEKPAHGWVADLKVQGKRLMCKARNVSAELVEAVNNEVYPMRSVELWRNYRDKGLALSAIAFLGGSNPEVGGMADFQFSADEDDAGYMMQTNDGNRVCFAYGSTAKMVAENGGQKILKHNAPGGGESNMTEAEIQKTIADGIAAGVKQFQASPEIINLQADNQRLTEQLQETQKHAAAKAVEADVEGCLLFAKSLFDAKKITPALFNGGLGAFIASLDNTTPLEFSAGKKQTRREFFKAMLEDQAANTVLFSTVDGDPNRPGEEENINSDVERFAAEKGLDPKILAEQYKAQRKALTFSGATAEEGYTVPGVSMSIASAGTAK